MWNLTHFQWTNHLRLSFTLLRFILYSLSSSWFKTVWILYIYCYSRLSCGLLSGGEGGGLLQTGWFPVSDAAWEISDCLTAGLTAMLAMYIPSEMWRAAELPSGLFETVVGIYVLNEKSQIPYGSCHAEIANDVPRFFFPGCCIDFYKTLLFLTFLREKWY